MITTSCLRLRSGGSPIRAGPPEDPLRVYCGSGCLFREGTEARSLLQPGLTSVSIRLAALENLKTGRLDADRGRTVKFKFRVRPPAHGVETTPPGLQQKIKHDSKRYPCGLHPDLQRSRSFDKKCIHQRSRGKHRKSQVLRAIDTDSCLGDAKSCSVDGFLFV